MRRFTKLVESNCTHCTESLSRTSHGSRGPITTERSCCKGYPRVLHYHNLVLRHSSTKRKRMYLTRNVRPMNTASSAPGCPARCRSNCQAATLQSLSAAFRISKIPTTPLHFPALILPALLQMIQSYYGVFAWKASHSQHYNHTPELSRSRGQHAVTPGSVDRPRSASKRNRVLLCAS